MDPISAAMAFVQAHFPECNVAFLAGSVIRGDATPRSDLDIVVVTTRPEAPFRVSYREHGWPIEAFIHTPTSYRLHFRSDAARRCPALPMMCSEGPILRDRYGLAQRIRAEALALLERGPEPLSDDELAHSRYFVTDLLDDLEGSQDPAETFLVANTLVEDTVALLLGAQRRWQGRGKWLLRALRRYDPAQAERLTSALHTFYRTGARDELVAFADAVLAPLGGRLFEGYSQRGRVPDQGSAPSVSP